MGIKIVGVPSQRKRLLSSSCWAVLPPRGASSFNSFPSESAFGFDYYPGGSFRFYGFSLLILTLHPQSIPKGYITKRFKGGGGG